MLFSRRFQAWSAQQKLSQNLDTIQMSTRGCLMTLYQRNNTAKREKKQDQSSAVITYCLYLITIPVGTQGVKSRMYPHVLRFPSCSATEKIAVFPDWKVGVSADGGGEDFVCRGGDCWRSPGCPAGFRRSPGASGGFYSERFGFFST